MENYDVIGSLAKYQKYQTELAQVLKGASEVTSRLNMSKEKELAELSEKVQNDTFKIMVTGTFKNGKSTFINALLGEEILPAYALPATAVINEVKYGTGKRALLYFREKLPEPLPDKLADKAVRHMEKYKGRSIPPLEIPYDEMEDYVVIPMGADEKQIKLQSPYKKVELFYPLDILQNGVEVIDSPGLNEDETRTRVTMDYLQKVDAILYVLNANAICAGDEMKFVKNDLHEKGIDSVFFVVNRFDQIRPREQPQIRQYAEMKLKEIYPQPELFCISAMNALDGRLDKDEELLEKSGIIPLEKRLMEFLTKEKGKAKLASPAKQVRQILSKEALEVVIPRERNLLNSSLDEVKRKYDEIQPRLAMAEKEKEQKEAVMLNNIERSSRKFERAIKTNIRELINSIPVWIDEFEPETSLGSLNPEKNREQVTEEICDYVKGKIDDAQREWQKGVLLPMIEEESNDIFNAAEKDISKIFREIDDINIELAGGDDTTIDIPFWKRVAGVAGGIVIGDIGLAVSGGVNGIGKEFVQTLAFEVGAGAVLATIGLLNPLTIGITLVALFGYNMLKGSSNALKKLKEQIKNEVVKNLSDNADEQAADMANGIKAKLEGVAEQIIDSVSKELDDIDKQVQAIIDEKQQGEQRVENRRRELAQCEAQIHDLNTKLDNLVFELVGA